MGKLIFISDCVKDELKTILKDWLVMYADKLKSKSVFELAEIKPNRFILKIDKNIDDTDFFYLVNYFAFPVGFEKTFEVAGYATASKNKKILNKNIYVFNNQQDTESDNVWITTEDNETYKFDFAGKLTKISENNYQYIKPYIDDSSVSYEQIAVNKKELLEEAEKVEKEKEERRLKIRFKIISILLFIGISVVFLIKQIISFTNYHQLILIFTMLISLWFLMDYKIFHSARRILICVLLSLLLIALGVNTKDSFLAAAATFPLSLIIAIWITDKFFGIKLDKIMGAMDNRQKYGKKGNLYGFFVIALFALSALISAVVFSPILKYIIALQSS